VTSIPVAPRTACYAGLGTPPDDRLEGDYRYYLQLWPPTVIGPVVSK
jgi:hypothetical protein